MEYSPRSHGHDREAFKVMAEARRRTMIDVMDAAREQCVARLRGPMATAIEREMDQVIAKFDSDYKRFARMTVRRLAAAERLPIPALRECETARVHGNFDQFAAMTDRLVEHFRRMLAEQMPET